ncbi:hypothetical protein GCM10011396_05610 [Undibacterium terreum]|uniref:DUF2971 domain-containing protein n=2 Tax=Undibacterium terreum TaxID=1224302 RepID=A0A916U617_9BURK|nr:hypothetical protein GCM10011396_05610 [Undibacterium terreum]
MPQYLRRYTDLPALLYMLKEKKITLLDPASWDDSNDSHYLSRYKEKKALSSVLAICFSQADETYHHWRVFSGSSSGVCIRFKREPLLRALRKRAGVMLGEVNYMTLAQARKQAPSIAGLPFIKRAAFVDEQEFRAIFESGDQTMRSLDITLPLSCIERISLSPWLHKNLADATKEAIKAIDGCAGLKVYRSTLIGNEEWKTIGGSAC